MSVSAVLNEIESAGIALRLDGERIRLWFPEPEQREQFAEEIAFLRAHRGEVAEFLNGRDAVTRNQSPYFWGADRNGKPRDYYGWRAHTALDAICAVPAPAGVIVWLGDHAPFLYQRLTSTLPDKISRAWNAHIAHESFSALCRELVDTYQRAVDLYVATVGSLQRERE
jgi:hypothetical protein